MNKNDKLIIILGLVILGVAIVGISTFDTSQTTPHTPTTDDIVTFTGTYKDTLPNSVKVSDENPFLALIATPLSVHYTDEGGQHIVPLFIESFDDPSSAVTRAESMIGIPADLTLGCSQTKTVTDISLELAETYWEQSEAALILENNHTGYNLGVAATQLSSSPTVMPATHATLKGRARRKHEIQVGASNHLHGILPLPRLRRVAHRLL